MTKRISPDDPILGPVRGSAATATQWLIKHNFSTKEVGAYLDEVYRLAPLVGIDPAIVVAQSALETGYWTSEAWVNRRNPAGIGILGDPGKPDEDLGYEWANGTDAARGQLVHLYVYAVDRSLHSLLWPYHELDPRLEAIPSKWYGSVKTIRDLVGKWATDAHEPDDPLDYAEKIARRGNEIFGFAKDVPPVATPLTFGLVPKPTIVNRIIPDADNWAWNNLGQREVYGVCYHTQVGRNWGTDGWFRTLWQPDGSKAGGQLGLTDYGVARQAREILQWNDPYGHSSKGVSPNRSPWASGPWENPPGGDGHAFVAKYGVNAINRNLASVEIDLFYESPFTNEGFETVVAISAWLADQARVPWTDYPLNPATGLVFTYQHHEFQNNKPCAGSVVIDRIPDIIVATRSVLKQYQTKAVAPAPAPKPPVYATPIVPPFLKLIPWVQEVPYNDVVMELRTDVMVAEESGIKVYQQGSIKSKETRAPLKNGEEFVIVYAWKKGSREWGLSPYGSRIDLSKTSRVREWTPEQIEAPAKTT